MMSRRTSQITGQEEFYFGFRSRVNGCSGLRLCHLAGAVYEVDCLVKVATPHNYFEHPAFTRLLFRNSAFDPRIG